MNIESKPYKCTRKLHVHCSRKARKQAYRAIHREIVACASEAECRASSGSEQRREDAQVGVGDDVVHARSWHPVEQRRSSQSVRAHCLEVDPVAHLQVRHRVRAHDGVQAVARRAVEVAQGALTRWRTLLLLHQQRNKQLIHSNAPCPRAD